MPIKDRKDITRRLEEACAKLGPDIEILFEGMPIKDFAAMANGDGPEITIESPVALYMYRCEEVELSIREVIELADELMQDTTIFDGLVFHSTRRTLLRVRPDDARSDALASALTK